MADIKQIMEMLFPAHAGVIPSVAYWASSWASFPRTRGGDPQNREGFFQVRVFSPHTRG